MRKEGVLFGACDACKARQSGQREEFSDPSAVAPTPFKTILWKEPRTLSVNPTAWAGPRFAAPDRSVVPLQKKKGGHGPMTENTMRNSSMR